MESMLFENLVLELSAMERADMLAKLQNSVRISSDALYISQASETISDYNEYFSSLSFFSRLFILIKCWIIGESKENLIREYCIKNISSKLEQINPDLLKSKNGILGDYFYTKLEKLSISSKYFFDLLNKTLEKNKTLFYTFLASLEFDSVHEELSSDTDPYIYAEHNSMASDSDVRTAINNAMESCFSRLDENSRKLVYKDVHNLFLLKKLASFPFMKLLDAFHRNSEGKMETYIFPICDNLVELASILYSMDQPPSIKLMESIIGFAYDEDLGKDDCNVESVIGNELVNAERALATIRDFNSCIPMELIVRIATGDPNYQLSLTGGGEDWFTIWKQYWKDRIDKKYKRFVAERKISRLNNDIYSLVGKDYKSSLSQISENEEEAIVPIKYVRALLFLEAFYQVCFLGELNKVLKIILLDGEFYKRDNRIDFTDSYNTILQIGDQLKRYNIRIGPDGELGSQYINAKNELVPGAVKRHKLEVSVRNIYSEEETILVNSSEAIGRMHEIISAILSREARGKYDSLINLARIDGTANRDFLRRLENCRSKLEKTKYLLTELINSETALSK